MAERPILFSAPMIRAILAGTKTQTRRALLIQPDRQPEAAAILGDIATWPCRYGEPGDQLWVRESWMPDPPCDGTWNYTSWAGCREGRIAGVPERFRHPAFCNYAADWLHGPVRWTPSIHMPRWASRIQLEVTGIRVERLQDISEADAVAEGICLNPSAVGVTTTGDKPKPVAVAMYRTLWEQINGPGSWDANPWVWCVEFRRAGMGDPG